MLVMFRLVESEGANVGSLENVRGNVSVANIATHTGHS